MQNTILKCHSNSSIFFSFNYLVWVLFVFVIWFGRFIFDVNCLFVLHCLYVCVRMFDDAIFVKQARQTIGKMNLIIFGLRIHSFHCLLIGLSQKQIMISQLNNILNILKITIQRFKHECKTRYLNRQLIFKPTFSGKVSQY